MNLKLIVIVVVVVILLIAFSAIYVGLNKQYAQNSADLRNQQSFSAQTDTTDGIMKDLKKIPNDSSLDNSIKSLDKTLEDF